MFKHKKNIIHITLLFALNVNFNKDDQIKFNEFIKLHMLTI